MRLRGQTREVLLSLALTFGIVGAAWFFSRGSRHNLKRLIGRQAPDIHYSSPDGGRQSLSQKRGRVILLNFWASWCTACLEEMPDLRMLENHFSGRGFLLLAINVNEDTSVRRQMTGIELPRNLVFPFEKDALKPYGVDKLPLSALIDRGGNIVQVYEGPRKWMDLQYIREIEELLD